MDQQSQPGFSSARASAPPGSVSRLLSPEQELRLTLPQLEKLLEKFFGRPVRPSPEKALKDFGALPEIHQQQALSILRFQQEILEEAIACNVDNYDERSLLRMAMSKLRLIMDDNLLEQVEQSDVVEILDPNQIQVYRSFSCFALSNYSLAELVTYPWFMLYDRPAWVEHKLVELGSPIYQDGPGFQSLGSLPAYSLREKLTEEKATFLLQEKFLARMISQVTHETYLLSVKQVSNVESPSQDNLSFLGSRQRPKPTLLS